jgi:hypothetical protein
LEKNCTRQKQFASNPETRQLLLMASNAKTVDGTQKSPTHNLQEEEF